MGYNWGAIENVLGNDLGTWGTSREQDENMLGEKEEKTKKNNSPQTTMVIIIMKIFVFFLDEILILLALLAYQGKGYYCCFDSL